MRFQSVTLVGNNHNNNSNSNNNNNNPPPPPPSTTTATTGNINTGYMSIDAMNPKGMSQKGISVWVSRYPHDWHR